MDRVAATTVVSARQFLSLSQLVQWGGNSHPIHIVQRIRG